MSVKCSHELKICGIEARFQQLTYLFGVKRGSVLVGVIKQKLLPHGFHCILYWNAQVTHFSFVHF